MKILEKVYDFDSINRLEVDLSEAFDQHVDSMIDQHGEKKAEEIIKVGKFTIKVDWEPAE